MFGIGVPEIILILIVGLIVFGPSKLPEVGRSVGKAMREFKKASAAFSASLQEMSDEGTAKEQPRQEKAPAPYEPPTQDSVKEGLAAAAQTPAKGEPEKINLEKETAEK